MELVQAFNAELSSLYEVKPPISKAKMSQITKVAIKGSKMYKHIVQSVERFIAKCRPEYKIPGLYVIDSIVRQSRHQFGSEKDVFGQRFTRNFNQTFQNLFLTCPPDDKPKIVRVLNLWQKNNVFSCDVIQPLLDMANPNANLGQIKYQISPNESDNNDLSFGIAKNDNEASLVMHLHQLATTLGLVKNSNNGANLLASSSSTTLGESANAQQIRFNKKLLDFDYGEDDEDEEKGETPTEAEPPTSAALNSEDANTNPLALSMAQNLLSNPELLQRLQQMQNTIQQHQKDSGLQMNSNLDNTSSFISSFQPINDSKSFSTQFNELDPNLIEAKNCENMQMDKRPQDLYNFSQSGLNNQKLYSRSDGSEISNFNNNLISSSDQSMYQAHLGPVFSNDKRDYDYNEPERVDLNDISNVHSRSRSPKKSRFGRSNYRDKDERIRRSKSRSPWRSGNKRIFESRSRSPRLRNERISGSLSPLSKERDKERERRRRGLPSKRKGFITICSTTLWLGHVPKIVSEADISNTFGEFGTINSIDLILPRGCAYVCFNRRQDANRALQQLKNLKLHGSTIKMAWAPGKGMKGKEYKDYWDVDLGSSYIPFEKVDDNFDIELLEDGGMVDEDTVPDSFKELRARKAKEKEEKMIEAAKAMLSVPILPLQNVQSVQPSAPFSMTLAPGMVVPPVANPLQQASSLSVGIPPPPPPPDLNSVVTPGHNSGQLASAATSSTSLLNTSTVGVSLIASPRLMNANSLNTESPNKNKNDSSGLSLLSNQLQSSNISNQNANHFGVSSASDTVLTSTPSNTSSNLHLQSSVILQSQTPFIQAPPLNVPPPSVISCQRPPPPLPWLSTPPPPILTNTQGNLSLNFRSQLESLVRSINENRSMINNHSLPDSRQMRDNIINMESRNLEDNRSKPKNRTDNINSQSALDEGLNMNRCNNFPDRLPPRLHPDDMDSPQNRNINQDRNRERFRDSVVNKDESYNQSMYEFKGIERGLGMRPHLSNNPLMPLLPRTFEDSPQRSHLPNLSSPHGGRERFHFERRFNRGDWRMQGPGGLLPPSMHFEDNMRLPPPNLSHHQPKDRNRRNDQWRDRSNRNDRFGVGGSRGHFNRNRDRGERNERQSKWRSPNKDRSFGAPPCSFTSNQKEDDKTFSDLNQCTGINLSETIKTNEIKEDANLLINREQTQTREEANNIFNDNDNNQNDNSVSSQKIDQEKQEASIT